MFDPANDILFNKRVLDAISVRAKVVMHNMANKRTKGYKRYVVEFEEELRTALKTGKSLATVQPRVVRDMSGGEGVNNVTEFDEIATLEKTRALHEIYTKKIGGYFSKMNKAILGR